MSENVEIPSFLVGYQVYQEGRMLILSQTAGYPQVLSSLSRRKDANSQPRSNGITCGSKSIKKEGC